MSLGETYNPWVPLSKYKVLFFKLGIVFLLFLAIVLLSLGYPYSSYDHVNYLNFLADPYPYYFEPLFTFVAYFISDLGEYDCRMGLVLSVYLLPLILGMYVSKGSPLQDGAWFVVILKSYVVGLISIRYWAAELWLSYVYIYGLSRVSYIVAFLSHYGTLGAVPVIYLFNRKKALSFLSVILLCAFSIVAYIAVSSGYKIGILDYSRYVNQTEVGGSFFLSFLTILSLCFFAWISIPVDKLCRVLLILLFAGIFKYIFSDLDVYSRIFQSQIDIVLVYIILVSKRPRVALFFGVIFSVLFGLGMLFLSKSSDMILPVYTDMFENVYKNLF